MKNFIHGFLLGFLLKKSFKKHIFNVINIFHKLKLNNKNLLQYRNKFYLLVDIKNEELYKENFINDKLQPGWNYIEKDNCIKIPIDDDILKYVTDNKFFIQVKDVLLSQTTLDIELFQNIGNVTFYIEYYVNNICYINLYNVESIIGYTDFSDNEINNSDIICITLIKNDTVEYVTNQYKRYNINLLQSFNKYSYRDLFINLNLKHSLNDYKVQIIRKNKFNIYEMNELI